jgi:hypothetical protein
MTTPIQRPEFFESQVLAAADLAEIVRYARNQLARHERLLHEWGIVQGLTLRLDTQTSDLTLQPGAAIDGTGREIVVVDQYVVPTSSFTVSPKDKIWFPVFLVGKDAVAPAVSALTGLCNDAQPTRVDEKFQVDFGNPGDELSIADQSPPADLTADPDGGVDDQQPWRILLGYVQWDSTKGVFSATNPEPPGTVVRRRYAGVRADDVSARGTRLTLGTSFGAQGKPQITIHEKDGGGFEFRLVGAADPPLLSVNANGDLAIAGKFTTVGQPPGQVLVESGTVFDGALLPLPNGITQQMVDKGDVTLHVHLTPHLVPPTPLPDLWTAAPRFCFVDANRRVNCAVLWTGPTTQDGGAACDFIVMAVFPPANR